MARPPKGSLTSILSAFMKNTPLTMIDLFAGCGGLSLGMEQAGFTPIFVNELNDDARASYLLNRDFDLKGKPFNQCHELHSADIYELTQSRLKQLKKHLLDLGLITDHDSHTSLDLICGGPPCQGYSGIGHRRSYAVEKKDVPSNQLYEKMAEIIEFFRPKIFLFENVKGLLSSKWTDEGAKGEIWQDVWNRFNAIEGYTIHWQLVSAKDYGVPQNRPRVLLVGIRNDAMMSDLEKLQPIVEAQAYDIGAAVKWGFLPEPTKDYPDPKILLGDLVDDPVKDILLSGKYPNDFSTKRYPKSASHKLQKQLRTRPGSKSAERKGNEVTEHEYSKHKPSVVKKFAAMIENDGVIPDEFKTKKFAQRLLKPEWPPEGPNITATSLPDDYVHFSQPRTLSVREWARLQMFPDWYRFAGKRTTGGTRRAGNPLEGNFDREVPKYTQIGNAVPVKLALEIGRHFATKLLNQ
ncbi:putative cytosine-specific methyltransferase [marine gamma proteobacterium HTCC2080]|jgi:DNA (cytosine-5)-methyltransferase 1|nr:putative cytosine-specific methyltransferase [marine gamma proteobacterium HTCC2080]